MGLTEAVATGRRTRGRRSGRCSRCQGRGSVGPPRCRVCGRWFTAVEIAAARGAPALPCGHQWAELEEERTCPQCQGLGVTW